MYKTVLIGFVILLVSSCKDNQKIWLQEYKNTKCNFVKTEADFKKDSILNAAKYEVKLVEIKTEIKRIEDPINAEIELLNHKIGEINVKYVNESRKISDAHEQKYGHNSTREFEKKLQQNDENNESEALAIENKITALQSKLKDNKTYQELISKQNQIKEQIVESTTIVKKKYTKTLDSLKNKLGNQNSDFRMILEDLNKTEKENFKSQREKINSAPCK